MANNPPFATTSTYTYTGILLTNPFVPGSTSALSPNAGYSGGGLSTPTGLAIDNSGNVWVTNTGDSSLTEFVGAAAPVVTPLATAVKNVDQGGQP